LRMSSASGTLVVAASGVIAGCEVCVGGGPDGIGGRPPAGDQRQACDDDESNEQRVLN
jgi:hypothetical protein